jgi:hypothetical protein
MSVGWNETSLRFHTPHDSVDIELLSETAKIRRRLD